MQNRNRQVLATAVAACALFAIARSTAAAAISYTGGDYVQNFDSLSNVNGDTGFPAPGPNDVPDLPGWSFARLAGTNATINFQVNDGTSTEEGQVGSWGTNGSTERALGSCARSGSTPNFGFQITNNTTDTLNSFTLTYTGEQWRRQDAAANTGFLAFSYSTSASDILTGSFSSAAQLNFVAPNGSGAVGALDGNAAGNRSLISATVTGFVWSPGQTLTLRWNDFNESDDDDWLAVDDLTFTGKKVSNLTWNTAMLTGTWDTNTANKPWLDETAAPSHFIPNQVASLPNTNNDINITVAAGGVTTALTQVSNGTHKYTLSGGPVNGPLIKTNAGTLVLKSPNGWNAVSIDTGIVETQIDGAFSSAPIHLSNGGTWKTTTVAQNSAATNSVNITGTGTIYTDSNLTLNAGVFGNNVIFVKAGPGLLWAKQNFPLTGGGEIHVDGGTLRDSDLSTATDGIPDDVILRIAAGATFDESFGNGEGFSALTGAGTYIGHKVSNGDGHISFRNNTNTTFTFNGLITAGTNGVIGTTVDERELLALQKNGIHTAVLTNPNSNFAGQVQINQGVLEIPRIANRGQTSPIGMGNIASVPVIPGADITFGFTNTTGTLRYTGPTVWTDRTININAGGIIEVTNPATVLTLTGAISGAGNFPFQKTGSGTLILTSDNNTFSGGMDVVGGKLLVNNPSGNGGGTGLLSVKDGATLGGTGTIGANVYIQTGGTLSPGESIGALNANATTLDPGAKLHWELNSNDGSADLYNINGSFDLLGQATIDLVDLGTPAAKTFTLVRYLAAVSNFANLIIGTVPNPELTYTLVDNQANQSIDLVVSGSTAPPQWNVDSDGSWGIAANWSGGIPTAGGTANFLGKITAPRTITLDGNRTVANLNFDNPNTYTIAQGSGGTLTVTGTITVTSGFHEISAPLSFSGNVTKNGPSRLTISGPQAHAAGAALNVARGQVHLNSNAGTPATAGSAATANLALNISLGTVVLGADQNLSGLALQTALGGDQGLDLASPTAAGQFRSLHVYATDLTAAKTSLYNAIKSTITNNADGIFDSHLAFHAGAKIGLAQVADTHGDMNIFIRPTKVGDLNLDGIVTIADFIDLASHFNGTGTWQEGDMNYDNQITIADFIDLASNFNTSYSGEVFSISAADAKALSDFATAHGVAVPEPAAMGLLMLSAIGLMGRRRK